MSINVTMTVWLEVHGPQETTTTKSNSYMTKSPKCKLANMLNYMIMAKNNSCQTLNYILTGSMCMLAFSLKNFTAVSLCVITFGFQRRETEHSNCEWITLPHRSNLALILLSVFINNGKTWKVLNFTFTQTTQWCFQQSCLRAKPFYQLQKTFKSLCTLAKDSFYC